MEELQAKRKAQLIRERGRLSEKARRERVRQFFQVGELAERAGLLDADPGFLLGYLLLAQDITPESDAWNKLKQSGETLLKSSKPGQGAE